MVLAPDVVLTWLAAVGVGLYLAHILRRRTRSPLESKMLLLLVCLGALFTVRGFFWIYGGQGLRLATFLPAVLLPLAATLFLESLLRRHAPRFVKIFVLIGTGCGLAALVPFSRIPVFRVLSLFLVATLLLLLWQVLSRDRRDLSPAENDMVDGITVAILLGTAAACTDFRFRPEWLDLRLGGLGGLIFVYSCLRLSRKAFRARLAALVVMLLLSAALAGTMVLLVPDPDPQTWIAASVLSLAFVLLAGIVDRLRDLSRFDGAAGARGWLLSADLESVPGLVASLNRLPLTERHLLLEDRGPELADYDPPLLASTFDGARHVWTASELQAAGASGEDPTATEQLLALLHSYEMGAVTLLSRRPVRLLLLSVPEVASAREWLVDLAVVHRVAMVLDRETGDA